MFIFNFLNSLINNLMFLISFQMSFTNNIQIQCIISHRFPSSDQIININIIKITMYLLLLFSIKIISFTTNLLCNKLK
jgi:hypothetical protein